MQRNCSVLTELRSLYGTLGRMVINESYFFECEKEEDFKTTPMESKFSFIIRQPLLGEG